MEKKGLLFGFLMALCLCDVIDLSHLTAQNVFDNYITLSNGQFKDGGRVFEPLCINYWIDYACYTDSDKYYILPHFCYSKIKRYHQETSINDNIAVPHMGFGNNGKIEMDSAEIKLADHLGRIENLGFNVVRLRPSISWRNNILHVPTGSYSKYFELTDSLIAKCAQHGLRVIMVLSDDTNTYKQSDQFCVYLDSVTRHYSSNKTVMAYVVYMEPGYKWKVGQEKSVNDKLMISNWSRKWYYLIKKNAPNQLVSIGLDGISNVLYWDPAALTYDFLTMHFYHYESDPDISKMAIHSYFKWMNDNVEDVWVIGETGFSATTDSCLQHPEVGTELAQYEYAEYTMLKALSCKCKGYAWWQYQDAKRDSCFEMYLGIYTFYPDENAKIIASLFPLYPPHPEYMSCNRPACYYNIAGDSDTNICGVVLDQNSNPVRDAYVAAWSSNYKAHYSTFTDNQGRYTIHTPADTALRLVWVSQKDYTSYRFHRSNTSTIADVDTIRLTRINYNRWKKNWTNVDYPITGDNPTISNSDAIVVGNFCDDEAQELLVVKYSTGTAVMYKFNIHHWEQVWTGSISNWQISSSDKFYAGDFDGNGYDELLCVQDASNAVASIFRNEPIYSGNPWNCVWTNSGNGKIGNWNYAPGDVILPGHFNDSTYCSLLLIRNNLRPTALLQRMSTNSWESLWQPAFPFGPTPSPLGFDKYYVGDFNGNGYDELFCTQVTNGTSDQMNILQYGNNAWNSLWSNNGISEGLGIYPYRANLHVGNFDTDQADELLGVGSWATKFDFNTSNQWAWSWSTYESGKLSDWSVNPNHRIFFLKTMTDVPDYLFVARGTPRINFEFEGYSYDP